MKKILLVLALLSSSVCAAQWVDPYVATVHDLDNATLEKMHAANELPATVQLAQNMMDDGQTERAYELMGIAADAKIPRAEYLLGSWLWSCVGRGCGGRELAVDRVHALELLKRAVQAGHPVAHERLADIYNRDSEHAKKDSAKAYPLYLLAAQRGFPSAQLTVAVMLCAGDGVKKDRKAGRKWAALSQKKLWLAKSSYEEFGC
jgi:TPR repeat protein